MTLPRLPVCLYTPVRVSVERILLTLLTLKRAVAAVLPENNIMGILNGQRSRFATNNVNFHSLDVSTGLHICCDSVAG